MQQGFASLCVKRLERSGALSALSAMLLTVNHVDCHRALTAQSFSHSTHGTTSNLPPRLGAVARLPCEILSDRDFWVSGILDLWWHLKVGSFFSPHPAFSSSFRLSTLQCSSLFGLVP
jgi:hypothetical protein